MTNDAVIELPRWNILTPDAISDPAGYWPMLPPQPHEVIIIQNSNPAVAWAVEKTQEYADWKRIPRANIIMHDFGPTADRFNPPEHDLTENLTKLLYAAGPRAVEVKARVVLLGFGTPTGLWPASGVTVTGSVFSAARYPGRFGWHTPGATLPGSYSIPRFLQGLPYLYAQVAADPNPSYNGVRAQYKVVLATWYSTLSIVGGGTATVIKIYDSPVARAINPINPAQDGDMTCAMLDDPRLGAGSLAPYVELGFIQDLGKKMGVADFLGVSTSDITQRFIDNPCYHYEGTAGNGNYGAKVDSGAGIYYIQPHASREAMERHARLAQKKVVGVGKIGGTISWGVSPAWVGSIQDTEANATTILANMKAGNSVPMSRAQAKLSRKILYHYHITGAGCVHNAPYMPYAAYAAAAKRWGFTVDEMWMGGNTSGTYERFRKFADRTFDWNQSPGTSLIDLATEGTTGLDYALLCGYAENEGYVDNATFINSFAIRSGGLVLMGPSYPWRLGAAFLPKGGYLQGAQEFHYDSPSTDVHSTQVFWLLAGATFAEATTLVSTHQLAIGDPLWCPWGNTRQPPVAGQYGVRVDLQEKRTVGSFYSNNPI